MWEVQGRKLRVKFTQDLVDWLNKEYPDINWFAAMGPTHVLVNLHGEGAQVEVNKWKMDDFIYGPEPFFIDFYNPEDQKEDYEKLIRSFAEWVLNSGENAGADIYLLRLEGELKLVDDDEVTRNRTSLRTCGVVWHVYGTL